MSSTFNVGQELYVGMDFDSKDALKNALKQYVMKVQTICYEGASMF